MVSSSLANWDGSQSAQNQKSDQSMSRTTQAIPVMTHIAKVGREATLGKVFNASFEKIEVDGRADREKSVPEKESQVSYTLKTKDDVSRLFDNESEPDIPNNHAREDDAYSLTDKDAEGETVDGDDAMAVDDIQKAPSSSSSKPPRETKLHVDSYGPALRLSSSPPSADNTRGIFTPPPGQTYDSVLPASSSSQTRASQPRKRVFLSHVEVPSLPTDSDPTAYRPIAFKKKPRPLPLPLPIDKRKRIHSQFGIESHQDVGAALQAAMNNNGAVQTMSRQRLQATNNLAARSSSSSSIASPYISASETVKQKKRRQEKVQEQKRVVEGVHRQKTVKASVSNPVTHHASGSRSTSMSVRLHGTEPELEPSSVSAPVRARAPLPEVAYAKYDSTNDMVKLIIHRVPALPRAGLELDVRFLEHRPRYMLWKKEWEPVEGSGSQASVDAQETPKDKSEENAIVSSIAGVAENDMTIGGQLLYEDEDEDEDEGAESEEVEQDMGMSNPEREPKRQVNVQRPRENVSAPENAVIPSRHIRAADPIVTPEGWSFSSTASQELHGPHRKFHPQPLIQHSASAQRETQKQPLRQHEKHKELAQKDNAHRVSEKALGKRRATSPELREDPRARPPPSVSSASRRMLAKHDASVKSVPHPAAHASQSFRTPGVPVRVAANPNSTSPMSRVVPAAAPSSHPNAPPPPHSLLPPAPISRALPTTAPGPTATVAGPVSPSRKRPVANTRSTPHAPTADSPSTAPAAQSSSARTPSSQRPLNEPRTSPSHRRPVANTAIRRLPGPKQRLAHTSPPHSVSASHRRPAAHAQANAHGHSGHSPSAPGTAPASQSHSTRLPPHAVQSFSHGQPANGVHSDIHELPVPSPPSASHIHAVHGHSMLDSNLAVHILPNSAPTFIAMSSPHHPHDPSFTHPQLHVHTLPNGHAPSAAGISRNFLAPSASHHPEPSPFFAHTNVRDSNSPFLADYDEELESSNKLYNYSSIGPDDGTRNDHTHSSAAGVNDLLSEDGRHDLDEASAWMGGDLSAMELVPGFVNGTIDPSLLGGGQPADENASVQPLVQYASDSPSPPPFAASPPAASPFMNPLVMYESRSPSLTPGPSHHQSPVSHRSRSSSRSLSPTRSVRDSQGSSRSAQFNFAPSDAESSSSPSSLQPLIRRHPRPARIPNGMIATGDLNLSSSDESWSPSDREKHHRKKKPAKRSVTRKLNRSSDSDEEERPLAKLIAKPSHDKPVAPPAGGWLRQEVVNYCHQCRRATDILKLVCPCERRFCVRCLTLRYTGEMAYDLTCTNFTCPLCKNSCNCDVCCRKRGEVYVSSRSHSQPTAKRPAGKKSKTSKEFSNPPMITRPRLGDLPAPTVSGPVTYWGAIYGFNGEMIGNAFVGDDGNEEVVLVRPLDGAALERKRERIFVGEVQEAWELGDQYLLKDVDPVSWRDKNHGPNERVYIGKKARLYEQAGMMPRPPPVHFDTAVHNQFAYDGDGDGFSSPLSSIEDDSDGGGPGEGESRLGLEPSVTEADFEMVAQEGLDSFLAKGPGQAFSADSLLDTDVARAISLGLLACGVAVQLSAC